MRRSSLLKLQGGAYAAGALSGIALLHVAVMLYHAPVPSEEEPLIDYVDESYFEDKWLPSASGAHQQNKSVYPNELKWSAGNSAFRTVVAGVLYFYSAFLDQRSGPGTAKLRINTLISHKAKDALRAVCHFASGVQSAAITKASEDDQTKQKPRRHDSKEYEYCQLTCVIPSDASHNETSEQLAEVMLAVESHGTIIRFAIPITDVLAPLPIRETVKFKYKLVACTKPIYVGHRMLVPQNIIEFVEWHLIAGYELFVVRTYARLHEIDLVLQYYQRLGIVVILQWDLPTAVDETLDGGELLAANDCLLRMSGIAEFASVLDIDQFAIARDSSKTIAQLLPSIFQGRDESLACYSVYSTVIKLKALLKGSRFFAMPMTQLNTAIVKGQYNERTFVKPDRIGSITTGGGVQECVPEGIECRCLGPEKSEDIFVAQYKAQKDFDFLIDMYGTNEVMLRHGDELRTRMRSVASKLGLSETI